MWFGKLTVLKRKVNPLHEAVLGEQTPFEPDCMLCDRGIQSYLSVTERTITNLMYCLIFLQIINFDHTVQYFLITTIILMCDRLKLVPFQSKSPI